jgi:hypothetical protein
MVDPIAITLTLLAELRAAIGGVKRNKAQCEQLGARADNVANELAGLRQETRVELDRRAVFKTLNKTLQEAAKFCTDFKKQHILLRVLAYGSDAAKFNEFNAQLGIVVTDANLALALDERSWRDAQRQDAVTNEAILKDLQAGIDDLKNDTAQVGVRVESVYDKTGRLYSKTDTMNSKMDFLIAQMAAMSQKSETFKNIYGGMVACGYASARDKCNNVTIPNCAFCHLHQCPAPGCHESKASSQVDCGKEHGLSWAAKPQDLQLSVSADRVERVYNKVDVLAEQLAELKRQVTGKPPTSGVYVLALCGYSSVRGQCGNTALPEAAFCQLHQCPKPGCRESKTSAFADCGRTHLSATAHQPQYVPPPRPPQTTGAVIKGVTVHAAQLLRQHDAVNVSFDDMGPSEIIGSMSSHREDAGMQHQGCAALAFTAINDADQVKIVALGGIETVVAAMDAHRDNADVQHFGCRALANLAANDANKVKVAALGGIEAVVAAMQLHCDNVDVQRNGCGTLVNLTRNGKNQMKIVALGGIEAIVAAMHAHGDIDVHHYSCWALANLAVNDENDVKIAVLGGIEATVASMNAHRGNADVQKQGCSALANMAANDGNKIKIAARGGIESIVASLNALRGSAGVSKHGFRALSNLAANDANKVTIAAHGAIEVVMAALKMHCDDVDVQATGCQTLAYLAIGNDANPVKIVSLGGIEAIVAAMNAHRGNVDVQKQGCWALHNITFLHKDIRVKANTLGVIAVVNDALKAFPSNGDIEKHAKAVISGL